MLLILSLLFILHPLNYFSTLFANFFYLSHSSQFLLPTLKQSKYSFEKVMIQCNNMKSDIIIKFCIVGEPSVGKTSMLCQYIHKKFDEKVRPTIGCDFSTKLKSSIDGNPIRLQLWDIAGQERFNAVSKMYLRGALGCIIVCSASEQNTLHETLKWKKIIEQNSDFGNDTTIPCLLVQNKSDLISPENPEPFQKKAHLEDFSKTHGFCGGIQTSAKENCNIQQAFQILLDQILKRGLVKLKSTTQLTSSQTNSEPMKLTAQKSGQAKARKKKCC